MVTKEALAEALRRYRFQKEWTLEEMASATGLHLTTICRLEKAKRNHHELTLAILVKRLPGLLDGQQYAGTDGGNCDPADLVPLEAGR